MWYLKDIATVGGQTLTLQQKKKLDEAQAIDSKTLLSTVMLSAPSASTGKEEMADEAVTWGHWAEDPNMAVCQHEGPVWQRRAVQSQQPKWVPMKKRAPPVPEADLLGLCTVPQKTTGAVAVATAPMARHQPQPTAPMARQQPQPQASPVQQQQPVQRGPAQPEAFRHLVEGLQV